MFGMKFKWGLVPILVLIALIILPTGTPEDLVTNVPIIIWLGLSYGWEIAALVYISSVAILMVALWKLGVLR